MNDEIKEYFSPGKKNLIAVYILYLCGVVAPVLPLIGVILAYINKDIKDRLLASHYTFLIRTFFMGLVGIIVSTITTIILIGPILYIMVIIWFVIRIVIGLKYLIDNIEYPNPLTFWIK